MADVVVTSALNPGDQVVEQEEDQDQAHRDVAEDAAIVSAGSDHGGETFDAASQQTRCTQEVRVLKGIRGKRFDLLYSFPDNKGPFNNYSCQALKVD